jgi:hypothetical protein
MVSDEAVRVNEGLRQRQENETEFFEGTSEIRNIRI